MMKVTLAQLNTLHLHRRERLSLEALSKTDASIVSARLMAYAASLGLNWEITYQDAANGGHAEPFAFRLVKQGVKPLKIFQVIGVTEEGSRNTISLTAANKRRVR